MRSKKEIEDVIKRAMPYLNGNLALEDKTQPDVLVLTLAWVLEEKEPGECCSAFPYNILYRETGDI